MRTPLVHLLNRLISTISGFDLIAFMLQGLGHNFLRLGVVINYEDFASLIFELRTHASMIRLLKPLVDHFLPL
jgi:hypothetical protein